MTATVPTVRGSIVVRRGDATELEVHHGLADVDVECSASTRYQIASVSKQFTAAAVLLLAERGALVLTDPVTRWLGDAAPAWRDITLHHLLVHTAGLGHWPEHPMIDLTAPADPDDLLATFAAVPPLFAPGAGWRYSSPGYVLLAHVVQRAADQPYRDFLDRSVFAPVGLTRTFAGHPGDRPDVARGHRDGQPVPPYELDVVGMGAGDIWSTAADMADWLDRLRAGHLLSPASLALMVHPHAKANDDTHYGYGWFLGPLGGQDAVYHTGENAGFRTFDAWLTATGGRVVMLTNEETTDLGALPALVAVA
jgi:CubicO group peptidase (beta-lactamase class C family)